MPPAFLEFLECAGDGPVFTLFIGFKIECGLYMLLDYLILF